MKKYILSGLFIISLLATSCSKENTIDNDSIVGKAITISANINNGADTRLLYSDEGASIGLKTTWLKNETFTMYNSTNDNGVTFSKTEESNDFEGTELIGEGKFYAVYGSDITNTKGVLTVDIATQVGTIKKDNGIKSFMVAETEDLNSGLIFNHKLAILKLDITLPTGVQSNKVEQVIVSGMYNKASYTLGNADTVAYSYAGTDKGYIVASNNSTGFEISENKITVYVAVFPENVVANSVTISAVIGTDEYSYKMTKGKKLSVGKVVPINVLLTKKQNFRPSYKQSDYYMWDAYSSYRYVTNGKWEVGSQWYNSATSGVAAASCKDCPTVSQMIAYLKDGVYWDDENSAVSYTLPNSAKNHTTGLWVKKKRYIKTFYSEIKKNEYYSTTPINISTCSTEDKERIRTSGEYFFVPAAGFYFSGYLSDGGTDGAYWLSEPNSNVYYAYFLHFSKSIASINKNTRNSGLVPFVCE